MVGRVRVLFHHLAQFGALLFGRQRLARLGCGLLQALQACSLLVSQRTFTGRSAQAEMSLGSRSPLEHRKALGIAV
ncbi:hypothetical protein CKO43_24450 [Rubrivivax gelatinosus]|uniref:Secreted protein n=1 Tax=Rubrivivax gelatinosus TaxID=28068 RepID=A0ABS1E0K4_RUBGE|nr:hypothetical protein [Rubrivivax gelatinosus]